MTVNAVSHTVINMLLKEWMEKKWPDEIWRARDRKFSRLLGVNLVTVWRWRNGQRSPTLDTIRKITLVTGGEVTANDMQETASKRR